MTEEDLRFLDRSIELARLGQATVFPNPRVGALFVRGGRVLGEGYHQRCGEAHAEVNALKAAGGNVEGATAYVSLEPCAHEGRTPSCAKMLIEKKVARVVYSISDPGPGEGGAELLRKAGVEVVGPVLRSGGLEILEPFLKNSLKSEAYFVLKWAMTLDGRMALASGDSKWVSGEASRKRVHRRRTELDGIMVGAGTVLADLPKLDVRHGIDGPCPRPIVWDPKGKTVDLPWWQTMEGRSPIVIIQEGNRLDYPDFVKVLSLRDAKTMPSQLFEEGLHGVLVEGGAGLHGYMLDHGLADALEVFVAGKVCGGAQSLAPVGGRGVEAMSEAMMCLTSQWETCGEDLLFRGLLRGHHPQLELYKGS